MHPSDPGPVTVARTLRLLAGPFAHAVDALRTAEPAATDRVVPLQPAPSQPRRPGPGRRARPRGRPRRTPDAAAWRRNSSAAAPRRDGRPATPRPSPSRTAPSARFPQRRSRTSVVTSRAATMRPLKSSPPPQHHVTMSPRFTWLHSHALAMLWRSPACPRGRRAC